MNVDKSKVMRCTRYINLGLMDVKLNDKLLYIGSGFVFLVDCCLLRLEVARWRM